LDPRALNAPGRSANARNGLQANGWQDLEHSKEQSRRVEKVYLR
jgi:hypothetical protein